MTLKRNESYSSGLMFLQEDPKDPKSKFAIKYKPAESNPLTKTTSYGSGLNFLETDPKSAKLYKPAVKKFNGGHDKENSHSGPSI